MVEILLKLELSEAAQRLPAPVTDSGTTKLETVADANEKTRGQSIATVTMNTRSSDKSAAGKKKNSQKMVDRRRRRGQRLSSGSSSEEEEGELSRRSLSDSSLSMPSESESEEDIQVLDSLSDSSLSDNEQKSTASNPDPGSKTSEKSSSKSGRRQIVLAANFNLAPSKHSPVDDRKTETADSASKSPLAEAEGDVMLKEAYGEVVYQSAVHLACSMLAEDSYIVSIRLFTQWLSSYSIVIATCTQVCVIMSHISMSIID